MRNFGISRKFGGASAVWCHLIGSYFYSWHEIGTKDLPAMIDYVLGVTEQQNLYYIGFSQGTTVFFVLASEKPEYNDKIRLMIALSPVAYVSHMVSPGFKMLFEFIWNTQVRINIIAERENCGQNYYNCETNSERIK